MKVKFTNIVWDYDGDEDVEDDNIPPAPDLPTELVAEVDDGLDVQNDGADFLSDEYGFCVHSFDFEILDEEDHIEKSST